jgi:GntR family transcriptional regulator, transcriptional repressor for pyruvate dehydrogenase complex
MVAADPADRYELDGQLQQPRLAQVVAGMLRERIVDGTLKDGERLPKQDDLLREFRVSRPSLREALRILESEGLLVVQRGNVGGAIVCAPSAQASAHTVGLVLQSQQVDLADLADAIRNVEPVAAALCAGRADRSTTVVPELRAALAAAQDAVDDSVGFTAVARQFHEEMVRGCGNSTLIVVLGTLELTWSYQEQQWARRAEAGGRYPRIEAREEVLAIHRSILQAIEAGDEDHAARLSRSHLMQSQRYALSEGAGAVVQAVPAHRVG